MATSVTDLRPGGVDTQDYRALRHAVRSMLLCPMASGSVNSLLD